MPELPEVETVMRGLQSRLEGRRIVSAIAHRADLRWKLPVGLAQRLTGARVIGFRRRGKYILMRLDGGASVLLHLGMSGRMVLTPVRPNQPTLHEHLVLETDDGWRVGFVDPRRFGSVARFSIRPAEKITMSSAKVRIAATIWFFESIPSARTDLLYLL